MGAKKAAGACAVKAAPAPTHDARFPLLEGTVGLYGFPAMKNCQRSLRIGRNCGGCANGAAAGASSNPLRFRAVDVRARTAAVACFLLDTPDMFFRVALLRCSDLQNEIASIYEALVTTPGLARHVVARWQELATVERGRGRLLHALATLSAAIEDDGPFLVQVSQQMAAVRQAIERTREQVAGGLDVASAERSAERIEATRHGDVRTALLEIADGEMRRVLRVIERETRGGRRGDRRSRSYRPRPARRVETAAKAEVADGKPAGAVR
jgi:hypothetical protein